jgi:hypothetical protein
VDAHEEHPLMPLLIGPAIDPTIPGPADVVVEAEALLDPLPPAPDPGPGDPDVAYDPTPAKYATRVQVLIGQAVTRVPIGELVSVDVDDFDEDVELLAGSTATIRCSSTDPLFAEMATDSSMGADGRLKYTWDPRGYIVWIFVDGVCRWTGQFMEPIDIGGGVVQLPAQGPQVQSASRILGRAEQVDLMGDAGSFEGADPVAGWRFDAGVEHEVVDGGVRGSKCLRVRGKGWARGPYVTTMGADGYGRAVTGSAFGKWDPSIASGTAVVVTWTQRTDSLAKSNPAVSIDSWGTRPDDSDGWTDGPVTSAARMSSQVVAHRTWTELRSFDDVWSYYDLLTIREAVQTGFPPGTERDLAYYVERIHRDLVARSLGGAPTGLTTRIMALTGVSASMRWSHTQRTPVRDVFSIVLDADGGPECRITPGWVLEVWDRLGADRDDIALSVHDVAAPGFQVDPGAQIDDFVVDTGRGSGAAWLSATASTPSRDDRFRTVAVVTGPTDRSLNEIESWKVAHARAAARLHVTLEVEVDRPVGEQLNRGDTLFVAVHDGDQGVHRRMRLLRRRALPKKAMRYLLQLGETDA